MKQSFFLILALVVFSFSSVYAQIGVKGGASFSAVGSYGNSEEGESVSLKTGFQLGAFYQTSLSDKVGLLVELNIEQRGTVSKKDYTVNLPVVDPSSGMVLGIGDYTINQEANSAHTYINLPVLFTFGGDKFKYYVGPNIGYLIAAKADFDRSIGVTLGGNPLPSPAPLALKEVDWQDYESFKAIFNAPVPAEDGDFLNALELGINVGAMYYLTDAFFVDVRVSQGIIDSTNDAYDNSIYPNESFMFESREDTDRNFSLQLSLGYQF